MISIKEQIDKYLASRPHTNEYFELDECEQNKFINHAMFVLNLFYNITLNDADILAKVYGEQTIYTIQNSILFEEVFQKYEGLSQMSVGNGAVTATVNYDDKLSLISPLAKSLLLRLHVEELQGDPNGFQISYAYNMR